ncbi:hypothetical protein Acr_12g0000650 [Actinidia rufa]|uniref:Retrotransposon gag domain-containing protein n=1 Tax=Actinidia rufa TaxID=165716 RepID=A0A7J0FFQ9_9ERIC|nr:hypothetical protein Acr_12g0000650 [Actinidia rufa]
MKVLSPQGFYTRVLLQHDPTRSESLFARILPPQGNHVHHNPYDCGLLSEWHSLNYLSGISGIQFPNIATQKSLLIILTRIYILHLYKGCSPIIKRYAQYTHITVYFLLRALFYALPNLSSPWSDLHAGGGLRASPRRLRLFNYVQVARIVAEVQCRGRRAILIVRLLAQIFTTIVWRHLWNDSSQSSMHLCSCLLPRPSVSSPLDNRAHPMANSSQAIDLEGLHRKIHGMAEQMRVMNEKQCPPNIAPRRGQSTTSPTVPPIPNIERSHRSHCLGDDHSQNNHSTGQVRRGQCRSPSPSRCERSSSSLESKSSRRTPKVKDEEVRRRGRSPRHENQVPRRRDRSTTQKIRDLDAHIDAINTGASAPITVDALIRQTDPPFTERGYSDEAMCKAFICYPQRIREIVVQEATLGTIDSFGDLSRLFVANFMGCLVRQKNASHLFTIHQQEAKSLKDYVKRFNQVVLEVEDRSNKVIIMAMMEALRPGPLFDSFSKNVPKTLSTLQSKADKYIGTEELAEAKRRTRGRDDKRKELKTRRTDYQDEPRNKRPDRELKR